MATDTLHAAGHHDDHHHDEHPSGIKRWLSSTNHKDIGLMYMIFGSIMFIVAGLFILAVRTELMFPGLQVMQPEIYHQLVTLHGAIMVLAFVIPAATGFNNYLIPLQIGAPDMALPRLNNWGFWILTPAAILLLIPVFLQFFGIGDGGAAGGWTMENSPLSIQAGLGVDFTILCIHLLGLSSVTGGINVIVTIFNLRAPGMTLMKMPLFCWSWVVTSFLLLLIIPVLGAAVTMLLTDRHFGTHFFIAAGGGDPILFQHLLWFFGHPEVYVALLPIWGTIPQILSTFARKPIFGYKFIVYDFWAIGILGSIVWAHHMLTMGMPLAGNLYFMYITMTISIPTAMMIFCWIATIWRGSMTFELPMKFALGVVVMFGIGGLTGLVIPDVAAYAQYHATMYVVGHFHYTFMGGAAFGLMAATYYYLPKMTGVMPDEKLGSIHFWVSMITFNIAFMLMMIVGLEGMPRFASDYPAVYSTMNLIISVSAIILGITQLLFFVIVIKCARGIGPKAAACAWEGAEGLEWTLPSPVPYHTFHIPPQVK